MIKKQIAYKLRKMMFEIFNSKSIAKAMSVKNENRTTRLMTLKGIDVIECLFLKKIIKGIKEESIDEYRRISVTIFSNLSFVVFRK